MKLTSAATLLGGAIAMATLPGAAAGPIAYGVCQGGCAAVAMACYAAAGAVWGATAGVGAPPAVVACNGAFGLCSSKCAAVALLAPIP